MVTHREDKALSALDEELDPQPAKVPSPIVQSKAKAMLQPSDKVCWFISLQGSLFFCLGQVYNWSMDVCRWFCKH
jgi:hypothetical protein